MEPVAIVASAQTEHAAARPGLEPAEMVHRTVRGCLEAAGVAIADVDAVVSAGDDVLDGRSISNVFVAEAYGAFLKEEAKVEEDGAWALIYALLKLWSGACRTALVVGYSKGSECGPGAYSHLQCEPFYLRPLGADGVQLAALQARRFLDRSGLDEGHAAWVASKNRADGERNDRAVLRSAVSPREVAASGVLASPVRRLEVAPVTDGCCAVLVAVEEEARRRTPRPAWVRGVAHAAEVYYPGHRDLADTTACRVAARRAYEAAGVDDPGRAFQVAEVHSEVAHQELMLYEALGLGEARALVDEGATALGGRIPVNPSGGPLCANPIMATGLVRVAEAALQVSGQAGAHQVEGARRAVAHAAGGLCMQSSAVFVLEGSP
ncbi:MAG: lipid-transfer protein [Planctomycetes bacterium]|nr:lipid-transfer protein [Planctomycetota bacterium]